MPLSQIDVHNVRIIERARCDAHPRLNIIAGPNASGKSSFLEAIHLLGTGRSFRTTQISDVIKKGADALAVVGHEYGAGGANHTLGLRRSRLDKEIRVDGHTEASVAALARLLPLQLISPESHHEFFADPQERRRLLNWGLFHMEPSFHETWLRYQRLLRQRNSDLRRGSASFRAWEPELTDVGASIHERQDAQVAAWTPGFERYCKALLGGGGVGLRLMSGWPSDLSLKQALERAVPRDRERGYTSVGPHRADLVLEFAGTPVAKMGSHGQQKLALIALRFAQLKQLADKRGEMTVVLVDDLAAELDADSRAGVLGALSSLPAQVFLTALDVNQLPRELTGDARTFHVEQGRLTPT